MVNDAFYSNSMMRFRFVFLFLMMMRSYLNLMMRFILIYLKLYFTTPPFPSFLMILIHFFPTLKFLSHSKNFKQNLSIACL